MKLQEEDFTKDEDALVKLLKLQEVDCCWQCSYHGGVEMLVRYQLFVILQY
jgi:hypothetical protein